MIKINIKKEVIKCPKCGKGFPVNYEKHMNRKVIQSPCCRITMTQKHFSSTWKPKDDSNKKRSEPFTLDIMRRLLGRSTITSTLKQEEDTVKVKPRIRPIIKTKKE